MKKKIKLFSTIAMLCLSLAILAMGVFSAVTVTYKTKGTITYEINDAFVDIETRIFSTSKKFNEEDLATKSQEFEQSNFEILNAMTNLDTDYTWNKVQLKTEGEGDLYVDTYSSVTSPDTAPEELDVDLKYQTKQDDEEAVYTYFVVTKLTNKSSIPLYITVPIEGNDGDKYEAPDNSYTYKLEGVKTLENLGDIMYVVFSMTLEDVTVPISDKGAFTYPISISIEEPVTEGVEATVAGLGKMTLPIVEGQTLQQVLSNPITINGQEISEYTTCGWFSDEALLEVADLSQPAQKDVVLYTKLATLDEFNISRYDYNFYYNWELKNPTTVKELVFPAKYNDGTYGDGVLCLEYNESYDCLAQNSVIESITLPTTFSYIVDIGSDGCENETLKSLNIHSNITRFGYYALGGCKGLELTLPNTIEFIAEGTFNRVNVENIKIEHEGATCLKARDDTTLYMIAANLGNGEFENYKIPSGISVIGPRVLEDLVNYEYLSTLTGKLEIPSSVRGISDNAFDCQFGITEIVLNEGLKYIGNAAFRNSAIEAIDIPTTVIYIGQDAFSGCQNVQKVTLNSTITPNERDMFGGVRDLCDDSVLILGQDGDENKITIKTGLFSSFAMDIIIIKDNVVKIEENAFEFWSEEVIIVLPKTIEELENFNFENKTIFFNGTAEEYEVLVEKLKYTVEWAPEDLINPLEGSTVYYYSETEPTGEGNYWYYNNDVPTAW